MHKDQGQDRQHLAEHKHITYDPYELMKIKHDMDKDIRFKQLPFGTVRSGWELNLNSRKRGTKGCQDNKAYQYIKKTKRHNMAKPKGSTMYSKQRGKTY